MRCIRTLTVPNTRTRIARSDSVPPGPPCEPPGKYACSPSFDNTKWRKDLTVPHDFVLEGNISKNNDANYGGLAVGTAW